MAKLFIMDLDGTLLNSAKEITPFTQDILEKAAEAGHYIVPATARGFYRIRMYTEQLNVDKTRQYAITFNGSVISDFLGNRLLDGHLSESDMEMLLVCIREMPFMKWALYTEDRTVDYDSLHDPEAFIRTHPVYKVVCSADRDIILRERSRLSPAVLNAMEMTSSEPTRMEFVRRNATKVNAIRFLADRLQIREDDIYAFGDGENDIGMLDHVRNSVAVANASDTVKAHASFITAGNDEDGVAGYIRTLLHI